MKEALIRAKVRELLEADKWYFWFPVRTKWNSNDIFTIFDAMAIKGTTIRYIQYTTLPNISARKKKIMDFFKLRQVYVPCEIWGWNKKKKDFKIVKL